MRAGMVQYKKGTPGTNPSQPAMTNTEDVHQYPLAYIYRTAGSTEIKQSDITSKIGTSSCPYITGILQVQSIDNIVAQWESEWDQWTAEEQTAFNTWFNSIQTALGSDAAGTLANHIANTSNPHSVTADQAGALRLGGDGNALFGNDLNNWKTAGIYDCSTSTTNAPVTSSKTGTVFVLRGALTSDSFAFQIYYQKMNADNAGVLFTRYWRMSTGWSSWHTQIDSVNISNYYPTPSAIGAVPTDKTSSYNFINEGLNAVNIDTTYTYNYEVAISEEGHGTIPVTWITVVNYYNGHFATQVAYGCSNSTTAERIVKIWVRERYSSGSWSKWNNIVTSSDNITDIKRGTTDLTAGTSNLDSGRLYLVYE